MVMQIESSWLRMILGKHSPAGSLGDCIHHVFLFCIFYAFPFGALAGSGGDANQSIQSPYPNQLFNQSLYFRSLSGFPIHSGDRYQTTRDSSMSQSLMKLFILVSPKSDYPSSPIPSHKNSNKDSSPHFPITPSIS